MNTSVDTAHMENVSIMNNPHTLAYYQDKLAPMPLIKDIGPIITGAVFEKAFTAIKRYPSENRLVETYVR